MPLSLWKWVFGLEGTRRKVQNKETPKVSFQLSMCLYFCDLKSESQGELDTSWEETFQDMKQSNMTYQKVGAEVETLTIWEKEVDSTGNQHSYGMSKLLV